MANDDLKLDIASEKVIGKALVDLLSAYPLLDGEAVTFNNGDKDAGIAIFGTGGALIKRERVSITDNVYQECMYPFVIRYRAGALSENRKINIQDYLDKLARWLNRQIVEDGNTAFRLKEYPKLTGGRNIKTIRILSPAYQSETDSDMIEDWVVSMQMEYTNEFIKE